MRTTRQRRQGCTLTYFFRKGKAHYYGTFVKTHPWLRDWRCFWPASRRNKAPRGHSRSRVWRKVNSAVWALDPSARKCLVQFVGWGYLTQQQPCRHWEHGHMAAYPGSCPQMTLIGGTSSDVSREAGDMRTYEFHQKAVLHNMRTHPQSLYIKSLNASSLAHVWHNAAKAPCLIIIFLKTLFSHNHFIVYFPLTYLTSLSLLSLV